MTSVPLHPVPGGIVIATVVWTFDACRHIGLGIPDLGRALPRLLMGKLLLTMTCIGSGF
ncbi:hypothetical protein [Comamonas brasiliensis]|uniref:hypothetical protein n=1 Tax=Comamonas brasiliensis TaxID=1812482 RepID=UPI001B8C6345|nr:hypothetical protein [Comamonas sp. PE63]